MASHSAEMGRMGAAELLLLVMIGSVTANVNYRLPNALRPDYYNVQIKIDTSSTRPENFRYEGRVEILLRCLQTTDTIVLHAVDLQIPLGGIKVSSRSSSHVAPYVTKANFDTETQFLILQLSGPLLMGNMYWLSMDYNAKLKSRPKTGLFYTTYSEDRRTRYMVGTMLEATYAREVLPCFDEPSLRATFNITIIHKQPTKAIANMPLLYSQQLSDGWVSDHFTVSPSIPTYLLVFVLTESDYIQKFTNRGLPVRMYVRGDEKYRATFALDTAVRLIEKLEVYFAQNCPLPKLDMIEMPGYPYTGLETWGAVLYFPSQVLVDPENQDELQMRRSAKIVAHEIIHLWLGNLVSLEWWDSLWMKEGLTVFLDALALGLAYPDWNIEGLFQANEIQMVMEKDMLDSSKPVVRNVQSPAQIEASYDTWTYSKSAALVRMLYHTVGANNFQRSLRKLLQGRAYSSMDSYILNTVFTEIPGSSQPLSALLRPWLQQAGFPLITVTRQPPHFSTVRVAQKHFASNPNQQSDFRTWNVPLKFITDEEAERGQVIWLSQSSATLDIPSTKWVLANADGGGYYRVNYDGQTWENLMAQLRENHEKIPEMGRAQLIRDAFELHKAAIIEADVVLGLLQYLSKEHSATVWEMVEQSLENWLNRFGGQPQFEENWSFLKLIKSFAEPVYRTTRLTVDVKEPLNNRFLRYSVAKLACLVSSACTQDALVMYDRWRSNPAFKRQIHPDIEILVMKVAVQYRGQEAIDFLTKQLANLPRLANRNNYYAAIANVGTNALGTSLLRTSLTSPALPFYSIISYMASNPRTSRIAWRYLVDNVSNLKPVIGGNTNSYVRDWLEDFSKILDEHEELDQVNELERRLAGGVYLANDFEKARQKISRNINWREANVPVVTKWLRRWSLKRIILTQFHGFREKNSHRPLGIPFRISFENTEPH